MILFSLFYFLQIHPDTNPNDPSNHAKFVRINEAYSILSRTTSRREYDMTLNHSFHRHQNLSRAGHGRHTTPGRSSRPGSDYTTDE